jgi:hypothetical protein
MYRGYIIKTFQNGGAKIDPIFAHGLSEQSIGRIHTDENFLMYDVSKNPIVNDGNLTSPASQLYKGYTSERTCELIIDISTGNALIAKINKDMENLKKKLVTYINLCVKIRQNEIDKMKQIINYDKPDKFNEYINNLDKLIENTKKKLTLLDKTFENNIRALTKAYNNDKNGTYPLVSESLEITTEMNKIKENYLKGKSDKDKKGTEFINDISASLIIDKQESTKLKENEFQNMKGIYVSDTIESCDVLNVNMKKENIKIVYNTKELYISFKNLCIKDDNVVHTPPSTAPPAPPTSKPVPKPPSSPAPAPPSK